MTKDEILEKSRKENKGADIVELEVQSKARGIAGAGMLFLGATLNLIACFMFEGYTCPLYQVMFCSYAAIQGIAQYILGKRRGSTTMTGLWLGFGLLMAFFTVCFTINFFRSLQTGEA